MPLEYINKKPCITGIPRQSSLCIVSLPSRREVINTVASGSYTPSELDPGKYAYTVNKQPLFNNPSRGWSERGEFLVDLTEEEHQRLLFIHPRFAKGVMTTKGARWDCGVARCSESFTSIVSIIQHEGEHLGIDFLHTTPDEADDALFKAIAGRRVEPKDPRPDVRASVGLTPAEAIDRTEEKLKEQAAHTDAVGSINTAVARTVRP